MTTVDCDKAKPSWILNINTFFSGSWTLAQWKNFSDQSIAFISEFLRFVKYSLYCISEPYVQLNKQALTVNSHKRSNISEFYTFKSISKKNILLLKHWLNLTLCPIYEMLWEIRFRPIELSTCVRTYLLASIYQYHSYTNQ